MWLDSGTRQQLQNKMLAVGYPNVIPESFNSTDYEVVIAIINKFTEKRRIPTLRDPKT